MECLGPRTALGQLHGQLRQLGRLGVLARLGRAAKCTAIAIQIVVKEDLVSVRCK